MNLKAVGNTTFNAKMLWQINWYDINRVHEISKSHERFMNWKWFFQDKEKYGKMSV